MPLLLLREEDVARLLDMPTTIRVVEEAFRQLAGGRAHNVPRQRARGTGIVLHSMSAAADYLGLVGWKQYTTTSTAAVFHVGLYDQASGDLIALIEANHLGRLRTGAVTGVAAKLLAVPDADQVGLFGTGWQAECQLAAVVATRNLKRALVYGRDPARRVAFASTMSQRLEIEVVPVNSPREAAENLPIVITATSSRQPVFDGDWLAPGTLVCAIGSNWLNKAEIDVTTLRRAHAVVCDNIAACQIEAGDFVAAEAAGEFTWSEVLELKDIIVGRVEARADAQDIIVFKSVGMALEDVAVGGELLKLAQQELRNRG